MVAATDLEVIAVRYGTRRTRRSEIFLHHQLYGEPDNVAVMDYYFWVIRNNTAVILVDCGFNEASGGRRHRTMLCPPVQALARLGIRPADVRWLVVSHGHYDHIGNLVAFPEAQIVIAAREYAFWTGELAARPLFAALAEADDIAALRSARATGRLHQFTGRHQLTPAVTLVEVGGHTPGELIVLVDTADGQIVLAADALHYEEELTLDRPFAHLVDVPAAYRGLELLRGLAATPTTHIIAGHDPLVRQRYPSLDENSVQIVHSGLMRAAHG